MHPSDLFYRTAAPIMQLVVVILMLTRRLHRQFLFFFLYTVGAASVECLRFSVRSNAERYFDTYWITEGVYAVLAFFAIQEIFHSVFENFYGMWWFRLLMPSAGVLALTAATLRVLVAPAEVDRTIALIITLKIGVGLLQITIFALFVLLVRFFRLGWRQHAFGIALGFGIAAAGSLVAFLLRSEFGTKFDPVVRITAPVTYIVAVVIWLITFVSRQPSQPLQGWGSALTPEDMVIE